MKLQVKLPSHQFMIRWLVALVTIPLFIFMPLFSGVQAPPALVDQVGRIAPRPVLLIAAGDIEAEVVFNTIYYEAAAEPKELWVAPDSGHMGAFHTYPEEYEERLIDLFDHALLGG